MCTVGNTAILTTLCPTGASNVVEVNDDQQYDAEISSHGEGACDTSH